MTEQEERRAQEKRIVRSTSLRTVSADLMSDDGGVRPSAGKAAAGSADVTAAADATDTTAADVTDTTAAGTEDEHGEKQDSIDEEQDSDDSRDSEEEGDPTTLTLQDRIDVALGVR